MEELAEIARKHGLTYQLAIDRPNEKGKYNFGATFDAFGIRAIPRVAVIDREGCLAFVGDFSKGLEVGEKLLTGKAKD